ncbi:MAG: tetratricopeptide repeat protein, partial [Verrucomicrobiota bacterium]
MHKLSLHCCFLAIVLLASSFLHGQELPPEGAFTADELLGKANAAFQGQNFPEAEAFFLAFERDYGEEESVKDIVTKNKALIALCMITNGRATQAQPYIEASLEQPTLPRDIREELMFWQAIHFMQASQFRKAQEVLGEYFKQTDFSYERRLEALTLFGTCYVTLGYKKTAAEFFGAQIPNLRRAKGGEEHAARCVVLQMHALIASEQTDAALALLKAEYPNLGDITQLISFQTLALQLGSTLMEQERYHDTIACLQRIWPSDRLLKHQRARLAELQERKELLKDQATAQSLVLQMDGMIKRVEREIENFEKIQDFDAALRLRLAFAFQGLERYREAALILEDMIQRMEPSPVVESASMAVIQCWSQLERWPKALAATENYLIAYGDDPENKNLPSVLFMQADAMMKLQMNGAAGTVFGNIAKSFPDHPLKPKARFMGGFCYLLQDHNERAISCFEDVIENHVGDPMEQDAFYWKGMALSFGQNYEQCSEHMQAYLDRYKEAGIKYEPEAAFRIAYCAFCGADGGYGESIDAFRQFLIDYGQDSPDRDEAYLLMGDALLGEGEADPGIAAYKAINPESTRFFEEGYFKTGKAYKLLEEIPTMRAHYESFVVNYPKSKRMPEAVYWIGWTYVQSGNIDAAKAVYWKTINQFGDDPELFSIEELLTALPKVYKRQGPDGIPELKRRLKQLYIEADGRDQNTLATRALWADAKLIEKDDPAAAQASLARLADIVDPKIHNPQMVADAADATLARRELDKAETLYTELRKWHPLSFHKARAYKGLAQVAEARGDNEKAIEFYTEYEAEAAGSTDLPDIMLAKIRLQREDSAKLASAKTTLENLLENPAATSKQKAESLLFLGDILFEEQDYEKSTAYFERVYVAYGAYRDLVAKAYFRRGEALEKMERP